MAHCIFEIDIDYRNKSFLEKALFVMIIYVKTVGLSILTASVFYLILLLTFHSPLPVPKYLLDNYLHENFFSSFSILLYILILGPLIEEVVFRIALVSSYQSVMISITVSIIILIKAVINESLSISIYVSLFLQIIYIACLNNNFLRTKIILLSISSILFGVGHLENFQFPSHTPFILMITFVIPQLLIGFAIGIVRIRLGFIWGVALHCLFNSIVIFRFL